MRKLGIQGRGSCHSLSWLFGFEQRSFEWWVVDAELAKEKKMKHMARGGEGGEGEEMQMT